MEAPHFSHDLKQFLFFLTFPENKQRVYREVARLSLEENLILIQMTRRKDRTWRDVA